MKYEKVVEDFIDSFHINKDNILLIVLYGSRIAGNYSNDSDLDVLLVVRKGISYKLAGK